MKVFNSRMQRMVTAMFAAAFFVTTGVATQAHALTYNSGQAILGIFGGETEYIKIIDNIDALTTGPKTNIQLNAGAIQDVVANLNGNPLQWSLIAQLPFNAQFGQDIKTSSAVPFGSITAANLAASTPNGVNGTLNSYISLQLGAAVDLGMNDALANAADAFSFTSGFGTDGGVGGYAWSQFLTENATADIVKAVAIGDGFVPNNFLDASEIMLMGQAMLDLQNNQLMVGATLAPVPVPAAGILFATGLLGLVGISRRSKTN